MNKYGVIESSPSERPDAHHLERLRINGFSIVPEVLTAAELEECRKRLDEVYDLQVREFGVDRLSAIKENDLARSPLSYDPFFLDIALKESILDIAHAAIGGGYVLLHLQNGIINRPDKKHHQSSWHRDLPYQEFVSSKPLAVGALFCIDQFTKENGCTNVLPFSHREEKFPSESFVAQNELAVEAPAGSVILFDAMLFHRAGQNRSNRIRRGINHVYSIPIIKPQIELSGLPHVKARADLDPLAGKILGVGQTVPASVVEFRERRLSRVVNS
jgi:ectoine hydroxylase-related dioxygenase (phytanoyl-CoA dioxygenase family)